MSTSSQPAPRRKPVRFVLGFIFGLVLALFVIRNWEDIKTGFRDGWAEGRNTFR